MGTTWLILTFGTDGPVNGPAGWVVSICSLGGVATGAFGLWLRFRRDSTKIKGEATSAAQVAVDASLASLQAALDRSDRDVASLSKTVERHLPALRREVANLSEKVDECEAEKRALGARVQELENAR